jgi:CubicO group peptidase (beta-lactamase class C family)
MKDTHFRIPSEKRSRLAAAYKPSNGGLEELPDGPIGGGFIRYSASYPYAGAGTYFSGGGGLVSTVPDYCRFLLMLRNGGELDGARILKKETVASMTRSHTDGVQVGIQNHGDKYGLGFGVVTAAAKDRGLGSEGTYSWGGFFYTYFWVDPKTDIVGIVMAQMHPWDGRSLWDDFRKRVYEAVKN